MDWIVQLWHGITDTLTSLLHWVEGFAETRYGGWALLAHAFAESSFFPIPPDVLLIALCLADPPRSLWFAATCTAGSVAGGMFGYAIGYVGGRPLLKKLFRESKIRAVKTYYDRYNAWATGIGGLTPLPYKVFTISGGAFEIKFRIFVLASVISRGLRFFGVAAAIYLFGPAIKTLLNRYLDLITVALVVLLVLGYWLMGVGLAKKRARAERKTDG